MDVILPEDQNDMTNVSEDYDTLSFSGSKSPDFQLTPQKFSHFSLQKISSLSKSKNLNVKVRFLSILMLQ